MKQGEFLKITPCKNGVLIEYCDQDGDPIEMAVANSKGAFYEQIKPFLFVAGNSHAFKEVEAPDQPNKTKLR